MKKLLLILLMAPLLLMAQEGVNFEHNLNWQQVQAKAKAEHKYIFMDCFTTWCGPCRYMTSTIFPQPAVANLMNTKFINVALQLDTTSADNEAIKSWYQTGHDIAEKYDVKAYPTYLIFNEDGKIVHRFVGSSQTGDEFVQKINKSFDSATQYYTLIEKLNTGNKDPEFLRSAAYAAQDAYDMKQATAIANAYLATQQNLYTKDNLEFITRFTQTSTDKGFDVFLNHAAAVDSVMGKGVSAGIVQNIVMREEVYPVIFTQRVANPKDLPEPDWAKLNAELEKKYPAQAKEVMGYAQVVFYMNKQDWNKFGPAVVSYMKDYGSKASDNQLNEFAWNVFLNCDDMACVKQALEWSKRSIAVKQEAAFMDTYANLLYKLGKKDEAIEWENKAMMAAPENDRKSFEETLQKMKNGEKTWN